MRKYIPNPREVSTWTGAAQVLNGLGALFIVKEAPVVADAVQQVGGAYAAGGWQAAAPVGIAVALGLVDFLRREKGSR